LAAERRRLPMVRIEKDYIFEGPDGEASLLARPLPPGPPRRVRPRYLRGDRLGQLQHLFAFPTCFFGRLVSTSSEESGVVAGELGEGPRLASGQGAHRVGGPFVRALPKGSEQRNNLLGDKPRHPGLYQGLSHRLVGHIDEPDAPCRLLGA
jgi:hypothetical protein